MYKVCKHNSIKELMQEYQLAIHCVKLLANGIIIGLPYRNANEPYSDMLL
jgi:hypothetical protein